VKGLRSEPESHRQSVSADKEFATPALQSREHPVARPIANAVLREFDRDTRWVAAGLLAILLLVALAFVVLFPERHGRNIRLHSPNPERSATPLTFTGSESLDTEP
jgi:hypothetical protein